MKVNKKKFLIHGIILQAMIIACSFNFQLIILWNLGYVIYFIVKIITKSTLDVDTGLFYDSRKNTDCGDSVVYDRKNQRIYFLSTLR